MHPVLEVLVASEVRVGYVTNDQSTLECTFFFFAMYHIFIFRVWAREIKT